METVKLNWEQNEAFMSIQDDHGDVEDLKNETNYEGKEVVSGFIPESKTWFEIDEDGEVEYFDY